MTASSKSDQNSHAYGDRKSDEPGCSTSVAIRCTAWVPIPPLILTAALPKPAVTSPAKRRPLRYRSIISLKIGAIEPLIRSPAADILACLPAFSLKRSSSFSMARR